MPHKQMKNTLGIHSVMWWKFHLLSYEKTHTEYHPFLCLKKGRGKFIPNSSNLNSYLYSQKSHFHELNGWKTGPMSPTVVIVQHWPHELLRVGPNWLRKLSFGTTITTISWLDHHHHSLTIPLNVSNVLQRVPACCQCQLPTMTNLFAGHCFAWHLQVPFLLI